MSVKVSTARKSAKTIQYIIHLTWGGGCTQRSEAEPAEQLPCPWLTQPRDAREPVPLHSPGTWMALESCL